MKGYFSTLAITYAVFMLALASCTNATKTASDSTHVGEHSHSQERLNQPEGEAHAASAPVEQPASIPTAQIPDFKFYKVKSGFGYEKPDLPKGKNTVFILFDPSCGHCQIETQALAKNYRKIKDVNVLYVSMNDPGLMVNFLPSFGKELDGKDNVEVLYDRNQEFIRKFHIPSMFPANYVYGPDGQLKTYWEGEKGVDDMIKAITQ